ncbi:MAG: DegT/DnrJ/EryC1/StrS family aminotransferase [Armatimonadetes bacterium]|nr:DegT/DnrJ/EryC1/StrS family aminotransferase [Armatimonadota bacterium]
MANSPSERKGVRVPYSNLGSILGEEELAVLAEVLKGDTLTVGPWRDRFEKEFVSYVDAGFAISTTSCTTALYLASQVLGLRPGDEVIVPPCTFVATALPVLAAGAKPVFADIDPDSFNINPAEVADKVTERTRAVIPVHYGGQPVDMDSILDIAREHNLTVIEDAAHAPGASYKGKMIGSIGDMTAFSFHTLKNMTTLGEGGMLTTNDPGIAERAVRLRTMGCGPYPNQSEPWEPFFYDTYYLEGRVGNNYRMSEAQAAVGCVQLKKLESMTRRRQEIAQRYTEKLSEVEGVVVPKSYVQPRQDIRSVGHIYTVLLDDALGINRSDFLNILYYEEGIEFHLQYKPIYLLSIFRERGYKPGLCPIAEDLFKRLVSLPIYPKMTDAMVDTAVAGVKSAVRKAQSAVKPSLPPVPGKV